MMKEVIEKAREGVAEKRYTLTELARLSDIPIPALQVMLNENWGSRVFETLERLERLKVGMKCIDRQKREDA